MSREIDRQIAELMKWTVGALAGDHYYLNDSNEYVIVPEFSSDWNAMRVLVEWLQGKGYIVKIVFQTQTKEVYTTIYSTTNDDYSTFSKHNVSAPFALCQAVLALPKEVLA
jgi:hypothetical protein